MHGPNLQGDHQTWVHVSYIYLQLFYFAAQILFTSLQKNITDISPLNFGNQNIRANFLSFFVVFSQGKKEHCLCVSLDFNIEKSVKFGNTQKDFENMACSLCSHVAFLGSVLV